MTTSRPNTWMPMYWADYWKDTGHLSVGAHGAYLNLVGACWTREGGLPADDESLSRLAKATAAEWRKLKPSVAPFFQIHPTEWRHKRVDLEIANTAKIVKARSEAGTKGNAKRWEDHRKGIANGSQNDPPSPSQSKKERSPDPIGSAPQTAEALNAERPKRPSPKRIFSDDWQPSGEDRQYAAALGLDPDGEARGCKNHSIANGKPYANHSRAYRNWCDKSAEFRASSGGRGRVQRQPSSIAEATASVIAAAARAGKSAGGDGAGGYGGGPLPQPHGSPRARADGLEIDDWGFVGGIDRVPAGRGENGIEEVGQDTEETRRTFLVADPGGDPGGMPVAGRAPQGNAQGHEVKAGKP